MLKLSGSNIELLDPKWRWNFGNVNSTILFLLTPMLRFPMPKSTSYHFKSGTSWCIPMKLFTSLTQFQITPHSELVVMGKTKIGISWYEEKSCSLELLGGTYVLSIVKKIWIKWMFSFIVKIKLSKVRWVGIIITF